MKVFNITVLIYKKKRRQVIRFKGTAIPTQHINTTHAIAQAFVSIVFEIGSFLKQVQ